MRHDDIRHDDADTSGKRMLDPADLELRFRQFGRVRQRMSIERAALGTTNRTVLEHVWLDRNTISSALSDQAP